MNSGAERIFGYSNNEALGRHIAFLVPDRRPNEEGALLSRLARGERLDHLDTERRAKDGRLVNVSLTMSPIFDTQGRVVGASKIARDISKRLGIARGFRESEGRYRC